VCGVGQVESARQCIVAGIITLVMIRVYTLRIAQPVAQCNKISLYLMIKVLTITALDSAQEVEN